MPRKVKKTRRPRRQSRRKKSAKVSRIIIVAIGFILLLFLGLYGLNYLKQNASSVYLGKTLSATEVDNLIKDIDRTLSGAFFEAGISSKNIESKKVVNKEQGNLSWEYKDIRISAEKGVTPARVKEVLVDSVFEEYPVEYKFENGKDTLVAFIRINDVTTHRIRFEFDETSRVQAKKENPKKADKKRQQSALQELLRKKDIENKEVSSIGKDAVTNGYPKSKIVIIVDDLGMNKKPIDQLLEISAPITFAVLPNLPYSKYAAEKADKKGWDVILHMPMEPKESSGYMGIDAGDDALLVGLPKDAILQRLNSNLSSVPHVVGVNNHMGSKFMENSELTELILMDLKNKDMIFIDSLTTPDSKGYQTALKLGMRTAQRDMFLDHSAKDSKYVKEQIRKLVEISKKNGYAVGICHPYPGTVKALSEMIPEISTQVEVVSISNIINNRSEAGNN